MNPRIEKLNKDIARTREQVTQAQARLREMEQRRTELENTEIVAAFRAADIPLSELPSFIQQLHSSPIALLPVTPVASTGGSYRAETIEEESDIEE